MNYSDNVFRLVHSLTASEKRFFRIFSRRHCIGAGSSKYYVLFSVLNTMDVYSEQDLLNRLKKKRVRIGHIAVLKTELFQLILRSLIEYQSASQPMLQLHNCIAEIYFLTQRGLYDIAHKSIKDAIADAERYELFWLLALLFEYSRTIVYNTPLQSALADTMRENIRWIHKRQEVLCRTTEELAILQSLYDTVFVAMRENHTILDPITEKKLDDMMAHPLLVAERPLLSVSAQLYRLNIYAHYYFLKRRFRDSLVYYRALVDLWAAHPHRIAHSPQRYIKALYNFASMSLRMGAIHDFEEALGILMGLGVSAFDDQAELFQDRAYMQLLRLANLEFAKAENLGEFVAQARAEIRAIEKEMKKYASRINHSRRVALLNLMASLLLCMGCSAEAHGIVYGLINEQKTTTVRTDLFDAATRFFPVLQYILGHHDFLVQTLLRSPAAYARKLSSPTEFDKRLFRLLRALPSSVKPQQQRAREQECCELIEEAEHQLSSGSALPGVFEVMCWLKSHSTKRPIAEVCREALRRRPQ